MENKKSLSLNRENHQLIFATKYYFSLCEKLINKFDSSESYLDLNINNLNNSKRLYQIHLASCCVRLSAIIEKEGTKHKEAYGYLDSQLSIDKYLPFFIRDTTGHAENPENNYQKTRTLILKGIDIKKVHDIIKEAIATRSR